MQSSKRVKRCLLVWGGLLLVGLLGYRLAAHPVVRCYLVQASHLDEIESNVYVDPTMPEVQRQRLLASYSDAKARVTTLYAEYMAHPVIIAGHTMDVMETYGGNVYNRAGRTYLTPVAAFIVLGPEGIRSVDVLAHELAHAAFAARVGYRNRKKVPNWFDEGLAVQFDERYTEAEWQTRTDNGKTIPDLGQIGIIEHDDWLGYATAKHEVRRWFDVVGKQGFQDLLKAIRSGDTFQEAYNAIEEMHYLSE